MALMIREIWVKAETEEGAEFREVHVISLYKATMGHSQDGQSISTEQMFVVGFYPVTGELVEVPLNETIIKTIQNEKTGEFKTFSKPEA